MELSRPLDRKMERRYNSIMTFFEKIKPYSPILVRYGIGLVFLLMGLDQLIHADWWTSYFPTNLPFNIPVVSAVFYNGIFDLSIGILLIVGFLTRVISIVASLHLVSIIYYLGYNDISIRDIGILLATISIFAHGPDQLCLDKKIFKSAQNQ